MKSLEDIDIFHTLEYIKITAPKYAEAKANRVYLEEWRKSLKSKIMTEDMTGSVAQQERNAYAHPEYVQLLDGLKVAVEEEEKLKWMLIAAQAMINCWQTLSANERAERKLI